MGLEYLQERAISLSRAHADAEHHGNLSVVPACVGGSGVCIGVRVTRDHKRVKLTHHTYRRAGACATLEVALNAGDGDAALSRDAHVPKHLIDNRGGLCFAEAELWMFEDGLGHSNQLLAPTVDLYSYTSFQIVS